MSVCALAKDVAFGGPYMRSTSLRVVLPSMMFRSMALASCVLRTSFPLLAHPVVASAAVTRAAATQIILEVILSPFAYRSPCCANHATPARRGGKARQTFKLCSRCPRPMLLLCRPLHCESEHLDYSGPGL